MHACVTVDNDIGAHIVMIQNKDDTIPEVCLSRSIYREGMIEEGQNSSSAQAFRRTIFENGLTQMGSSVRGEKNGPQLTIFPDGERICAEEGHSCIRRIISFKHLPGRRVCRPVHRCIREVLEHLPSWELWRLGDLRPRLEREVADVAQDVTHELQEPPQHVKRGLHSLFVSSTSTKGSSPRRLQLTRITNINGNEVESSGGSM